ncbi:MAG TPA: GIY-YIG nuclease family protein [Thermoanaerobaculia bacterium]|nr:GIY-YIG nuclease family protein [Thermoanaerobaculia bacterium]
MGGMTYPHQRSLWRSDGSRTQFAVYIMSNNSMTLYTGVTDDLQSRVQQHKSGQGSKFTSRYHFDRCVYYEIFDLITEAIEREKQIKGWTRSKKIALIKSVNPEWRDLVAAFS